ncbi:MAG: NAD(P)H-dependent oxidoreductase [Bacteroidetes bacterium]|nr:NAD(P)H-dependent oxidoreductase [Bacteroidota bacterium]
MKNICAMSGSLRTGSSNHTILRYLSELMPAGINYVIYDGLANIPAFDPGLDNDDPPPPVSDLRDKIAKSDAIVICTPEYAFGVPGALKNALDWTVSSGSLSGKPLALITASTSGQYAHEGMIKTLGALDAQFNDETTLLIPFIRTKIDAEGNINDEIAGKLRDILKALLSSL